MVDSSDPKIVERLKKLPPFDDEEPVETPAEPQETVVDPETPVEEPKEEEKPVETVEEPQKDEKTRTQEQFDKLKEHNAQLKKKLEEAKAKAPTKDAFDALFPEDLTTNIVPDTKQYPVLTKKEIADTFANLTDDQGFVDTGLLKETLTALQNAKDEAERKLKDADDRVKKVERRQDENERKVVMKLVHERFPRLDPENVLSEDPEKKFDQKFYDLFQDKVVGAWTRFGTADPMKVAEEVDDILYPVKKADKEKAEAAELAKKNINATTIRPASTVNNFKDQDELIKATQLGKRGALAERLARAGY